MEALQNIKERKFASEMKMKYNFSIKKSNGTIVFSFKVYSVNNKKLFIETEYIFLN